MRLRLLLPTLAAALALGLLGRTALAQSCGGCSGPAVGGAAASDRGWLDKDEAVVRLSDEYEVKDRAYDGHGGVPNDFNESLVLNRATLDVRYGVTDEWSAQLQVPQVHTSYRLRPPGGDRQKVRLSGIGDIGVFAGRSFALAEEAPDPEDDPASVLRPGDVAFGLPPPREERERVPRLSFWAGLSLPTGETQEPNADVVLDDVSVTNLQIGTGTFDPAVRVRLEVPADPFILFAEAGLRYPLYENRHEYRTAHSEGLTLGAQTEVLPRFHASASLLVQRVGRDRFDGDDVGVGGGEFVYASVGVAWEIAEGVAIDASVRVPLWRDTQTKLLDSDLALQGGITFNF